MIHELEESENFVISERLKSALTIIGTVIGIVGAVWVFAETYFGFKSEIKQLEADHSTLSKKVDALQKESTDFKQFALRELERSRKPSSPRISADRLSGKWNMKYGNSEGELGVKAINDRTIEFVGQVSQGKSSPTLTTRGRGVLTETARGPHVELSFHTKASSDPREWTGTAYLDIFSADFAQGWIVDQEEHMQNIELRRLP